MKARSWLIAAAAATATLAAASASAAASTGAGATQAGATRAGAARAGAARGVAAGGAAPARGARALEIRGFRLATGVRLPSTRLPRLAPKMTVFSTNWGGHAATTSPNSTLKQVSAAFNVPSVNCAGSPPGSSGYAYASHWVGLDGYNDDTTEQAGVAGYCTSTAGAPAYVAWYEMFPLPPVPFTGINPGDAITASVGYDRSAGLYNLTVTDVTTGGVVSASEPCPSGYTCRRASAEVITEDPGGGVAGGYNLADFGQENYTGATVVSANGTTGTLTSGFGKSGAQLWSGHQIVLVDPSGTPLAVTGPLYGGQAYNIAWSRAS
jgi:Peptidase A4 family